MKLRFSIRDLLWLTLVVAVASDWVIHGRKMTEERDEAKSALKTAAISQTNEMIEYGKARRAELEEERPFLSAS